MFVVKSNKPKWAYSSLPSMFDEFFNHELTTGFGSDFQHRVPQVNIVKSENAYELQLAAPGLKKENFEVKVDNDVLTFARN